MAAFMIRRWTTAKTMATGSAGSSVPVAGRASRNAVVLATLGPVLITVADGGYPAARAASLPGPAPATWTIAALLFAIGAAVAAIGVRRVRAANGVRDDAGVQR